MKTNANLEDNAARLFYKLINNLLYFDDNEKDLRIYILIAIEAEIFKLAHDEIEYLRYI